MSQMIKMNCQMKFPMISDTKMSFRGNFILLFALLLLPFFAQAKEIPKKTRQLVNDYVHVMSESQRRALERKLEAYNDTTSTQIAVVIERSTEGEDIFGYTIRLAENWGIGQDGKDNGILIYIATDDRKMRILTGYGAEPTVTDAMAKRIIEKIIIPAIRQGKYYEGLDKATTKISQLAAGEFSADDSDSNSISPLLIFLLILLLFFLFAYLASKSNGGKGGGYYRGGHYDDPWRGSGGWWIGGGGSSGGGGGGFSGGGGFGGFGGGSFGGGGAGGSW